MTYYETLSIIAQFSIVAATIVYALISFGQWQAIRSVARQQTRPWLMVTPDSPKGWPSDNVGPCAFHLRWSVDNVGKSPAFLTQFWADVVVAPYPVPDKRLNYGETSVFAELIIRPNGNHVHGEDRVLTEHEAINIQTEEKCLLFYGFADYRDTFKATHRTCFCSYWRQEGEKVTFSPVGPPSYIRYT